MKFSWIISLLAATESTIVELRTVVGGGVVLACALYPDEGQGGQWDGSLFSAGATGGDVIAEPFNIPYLPNCIEIWNATDDAVVDVSAMAFDLADGVEVERVVTIVGDGSGTPPRNTFLGATSATGQLGNAGDFLNGSPDSSIASRGSNA